MTEKELARKIENYYNWLQNVQVFVENVVVEVAKAPNDHRIERDTDNMTVDGYSLRGQNIEISRATGNVFISGDLLTFGRWMAQQ